jgi:hypothetical protein
MHFSSLKRPVFFILLLLSHEALFMTSSWGMTEEIDPIPLTKTKPQENQPCTLMNGIALFEEGDLDAAAKILLKLRHSSIIAIAYLDDMQKNGVENIPKDDRPYISPLPDAAIKLGQDFLRASVAYKQYISSETDEEKRTHILKLFGMIRGHNAHALALVKRNEEKILTIFDLKSLNALYAEFIPACSPAGIIGFWDV